MMGFKRFLEETEEQEDVGRTLKKLPKNHAALVQGYKWRFQPGNILNGDDDHIGAINDKDRTVHVAAPWNYGREFTVLHEIGHRVWERFVTEEMKKQWSAIVKKTKNKQRQNAEELFCMAYANHYAKNKIVIHNHPEWDAFVKKIPC